MGGISSVISLVTCDGEKGSYSKSSSYFIFLEASWLYFLFVTNLNLDLFVEAFSLGLLGPLSSSFNLKLSREETSLLDLNSSAIAWRVLDEPLFICLVPS